MPGELVYNQSEALIVVTLMVLLVVGAEVGYRLGCHCQSRIDDSAKSQIGSIQSAVVSLLGLLLGFTLATSRTNLGQSEKPD